ncbi:MAG TPA: hypothetical protein VEO95_03025, partial [Chthoniobacteraceae bacterium]|nr:hypothetical protein [Chthoniobacteraceae bacterium]
GQTEQAYAGAAFGFQAQQTERAFAQVVKEMDLTQQDALAWEPPEIAGHQATVRVEVTAKSGRKLPFVITLVDESGAWRVHSLRSPGRVAGRTENRFTLVGKGAAFSDAQSQRMPDEQEIRQMVLQSLAKFDEAIQRKSFAEFYAGVSAAWQKQLTVGQLERAFQPFIDAGVRIGGLKDAEMKLDGPPAINSDGVLVVNGHFHTAPYQVYFSMKFMYDLPRWKLFGLDVNLQH